MTPNTTFSTLLCGVLAASFLAAPVLRAQDGRGAGVRPLAPGQRVALVIGNADYNGDIGRLKNPINDATDVALALRRLGFSLVGGKAHLNMNKRQMLELIREFGGQMQRSDVGVFYFAGHGVQVDRRNYLIPITDLLQYQEDAEYEAVDADAVLREMEDAENPVKILILDACRNNNLAKKRRSTANGLTDPSRKPEGTLIAFSTADGQTASDNSEGRNGLFTQELLKYLETPNLPLDRIFRTVRNEVKRLSKNSQLPFFYHSLSEDVFLNKTESAAAQPPPQPLPKPQPPLSPNVSGNSASRPNVTPDAGSLAQQALSELMRGNNDSAKRLAASALKINKNLPSALAVSGWLRRHDGRMQLEKAIQLEPQNPFFLALFAYHNNKVYRDKNYDSDKELAKKLANQVLTLEPKSEADYYARGIAQAVIISDLRESDGEQSKRWSSSVVEFTKVIELNPLSVLAYEKRGAAYYKLKKYSEAVADYSKLIELKPNDPVGYYNRGSVYKERREDYDKALEDFDRATKLLTRRDRFGFLISFHRGGIYFNKGQYEQAVASYTAALQLASEIKPLHPAIYSKRAEAYDKAGRPDLAETDRKKVKQAPLFHQGVTPVDILDLSWDLR